MNRGDEAAKQSFSVRWSPRTLAHLHAQAEDAQIAPSVLAERYVEEGLRMFEHPLIFFRDSAAGRRPALMGTRLDVATVVSTVRQNENSAEEAADYLRLPLPLIDACLRYYIDYQGEVDAWLAREAQAAEAAESSCRRRHELFA